MVHRPKDLFPSLPMPIMALTKKSIESQSVAQDKSELDAKDPPKPKQKTSDLFSAHDFDIKIDLEVPLPSKYHIVNFSKYSC